MRKGKGIFDVIVLVDNGWGWFRSAESRDCSDFDCGDSLLIFVFDSFRCLDWGTDVDDGGRLLGDTGTGDEAINDGLDFGPASLAEIHFDIPVHIIEAIVPACRLGNTMYCFIFWKVEIGIGPFLAGLGWCGNIDHSGK